MSTDQRDWYRAWWRKKTGYVERSTFRLGHADIQRKNHRAAWLRNLVILAVVVFGLVVIAVFRRFQ